jgi:dienelactone hydrolase
MKTILLIVSLLFSLDSFAGKEIIYKVEGKSFKGYFAKAKSKTDRPLIIVVHEWWGHNKYARKRADMLAQLGYNAFALDMYGNGKTASHPKEAGEFAMQATSNIESAKKRFLKAIEVASKLPGVKKDQVAAIGYCFGGGVALNMARMGVNLKGVVSFHGALKPVQLTQAGIIKAKLLVQNGADDPFVKKEEINAFKKEMDDAKVSYEFINYPHAKHSFTNPMADKFGKKFSLPLAYNKEADQKSWKKMQEFFKELF